MVKEWQGVSIFILLLNVSMSYVIIPDNLSHLREGG